MAKRDEPLDGDIVLDGSFDRRQLINGLSEEQRKEYLKTCYCVGFVDLLGTTEKTRKVDIQQILHGDELATIWWFLAHLCKVDPALKVSGISDSLVLVRQDFTKLVPVLVALFQISFLTRGFRIRAGIEIGNVYGVESFHHDLMPFIRENNLSNLVIPPYIIGDAMTNAVLAEKKLKGSRIVLGESLQKAIRENTFTELGDIFVERKLEKAMEIRWTGDELTRAVFDQLNGIKTFTRPHRTLGHRFRLLKESPEDDYSKVMLGLGIEWGVIKATVED